MCKNHRLSFHISYYFYAHGSESGCILLLVALSVLALTFELLSIKT